MIIKEIFSKFKDNSRTNCIFLEFQEFSRTKVIFKDFSRSMRTLSTADSTCTILTGHIKEALRLVVLISLSLSTFNFSRTENMVAERVLIQIC